jgi:parvulin-like peptidyl-prolyl isomerase
MLDRLRSRGGPGSAAPRRHMTRREKEHRQRQILLLGTGAAAVIVVLALVIGAVYQFVWFPRQSVASVDGTEIRRSDYVKVRNYNIRQEIARLSQQMQTAQPDQQPQMQARLVQLQEELGDLEGGTVDLHPETVATMIDDRLVLDNIESLGITITDADVDQYVLEIFSPIPLGDPTPMPTVEPTAAAWATETTEAFAAQVTQTVEAQATQAAQPNEDVDATPGSDTTPASPDVEMTPTEAPAGTPTPDADVEPTEEVEPLPTVAPTEPPTRDEAVAASQANYDQLEINFLEPAGMSRGDFERLIVRPALARQRAQEELAANVSPRAAQAHLAHILVATQEAAQDLYDNRLQDEAFEDVAVEVSIDAQTAPNGGDLGWNPSNAYVAGFGDAAFALEPGEISEPVQTEFGWHIIKMLDFEEDRPLTIQAFNQQQAAAFQIWLDDLRENADIESDVQLPGDDMPPLPPIG